jgi:proline iminopeptidase
LVFPFHRAIVDYAEKPPQIVHRLVVTFAFFWLFMAQPAAAQSSPSSSAAPPCSFDRSDASKGAQDGCTFTREEVTSIIHDARKIVSPNGVEELLEIPLGGTKQWIYVRRHDRRNPILLMIHGGPAAPEMPSSWFFQNGWEDYFTVVQWDRRGSGKTYNFNDPDDIRPTLTLKRMVDDAGEVVQYLRNRYKKNKIFALGHSSGSIIGVGLPQKPPRMVVRVHRSRSVDALKAIAPYPKRDGSIPMSKIDIERNWSVKLGGLTYRRDSFAYYEALIELSLEYTAPDVIAIDKGSDLSFKQILLIMASVNYDTITRIDCPILLFEGRHDSTTSSPIAAKWLQRLRAPSKKIVWFDNSAHMVCRRARKVPGPPGAGRQTLSWKLIFRRAPISEKAGFITLMTRFIPK